MGADPAQLQQIAQRLNAGFQQATNSQVQQELVSWLQQNVVNPTFNVCLGVIASTANSGLDGRVRQIAALQLKKSISGNWKVFEQGVKPVLAQIQPALLTALVDEYEGVRRAAAASTAALVRTAGVASWPSLVGELWQRLVQARDPTQRLGILQCICDICEDVSGQLAARPGPGQQAPAEHLLQGLVQMMTTENDPKVLSVCIESVYHIMESPLAPSGLGYGSATQADCAVDQTCRALVASGGFISALQRATQLAASVPAADPNGPNIRQNVLRVYRLLLLYYAELKAKGVIGTMLTQVFEAAADQQATNQEVALSACEFWSDYARNSQAVQDITQQPGMLPQLIGLLLSRMPYADLEVSMLEDDERKDDCLPATLVRGRRKKKREDGGAASDDEGDGGHVEQWTVRKAAAYSLDCFSTCLQDQIVSPPGCAAGWLLQEHIQQRLQHQSWKEQEVAILAIGAICKGATVSLKPHLDGIVQHLFTIISDEAQDQYHFLVRSISCWTLSRLDDHIINHTSHQLFFERYLQNLLGRLTDKYRKVQECAVSAFAQLMDNCCMDISQPQYIQLIATKIGMCIQQVGQGYTTRNMVVLLDALGTLCWTARDNMNTDQVRQQLFDPLWKNVFPAITDDNPLLPHLMTCLRRCVEGMGQFFSPYIPSVYPRLLAVIGAYWQGLHTYRQGAQAGQVLDPPEYNHCNFALRLMGCIISELKESMRSPMNEIQLPGVGMTLPQLAFLAIDQGAAMEVDRMVIDASNCFIGDAIKTYPDIMVPQILQPQRLTALLALADKDDPCSNNVVWLCGEIATALTQPPFSTNTEAVNAAIVQMANTVVPILVNGEWYFQILQNAALTCGKFGNAATALMAPQLGSFLKQMCSNLAGFPDHPSKKLAWEGVMKMLSVNFAVLQNPENIGALAKGIAGTRWRPPDLLQLFIGVVRQLHQAAGAAWPQVRGCFPPNFPAEVMSPVDPTWSVPPPPPGIPPPRATATLVSMPHAAAC